MRETLEELNKALGHLENVSEQLEQQAWPEAADKAGREIIYAINFARHALELLTQLKEETCEKS